MPGCRRSSAAVAYVPSPSRVRSVDERLLRRVRVAGPELRDAELEARQGGVGMLLHERRQAVDGRLRARRVVAQRQPRRGHARVVRARSPPHARAPPRPPPAARTPGRPRPARAARPGRPAASARRPRPPSGAARPSARGLRQRQHQQRRAARQRLGVGDRGGRLRRTARRSPSTRSTATVATAARSAAIARTASRRPDARRSVGPTGCSTEREGTSADRAPPPARPLQGNSGLTRGVRSRSIVYTRARFA